MFRVESNVFSMDKNIADSISTETIIICFAGKELKSSTEKRLSILLIQAIEVGIWFETTQRHPSGYI